MESNLLLLLLFCAGVVGFIYYNAKTDPKIIAEKEAKDAQLKEIYSKMTDDELVVIGVKTPEEVEETKLNAIYAKLSEDEIAVVQGLIKEKKKKQKMEKVKEDMVKQMYDTTNNPSYASMPGNVAHQNYLYNNKIK